MPEFLVFQLQGVFASWGEPAVGEFRGTAEYPSLSALIGLLGAGLGLLRHDEAAHAALLEDYGYAVGVQETGALLRDYHTAQVPPRTALKGRPHATRRDELTVPKHELTTILSARDYRQDGASLVAVQARPDADPPYTPAELARALANPRFVLYLGRKACPPAAPLWPHVIETESARVAFERYAQLHEAAIRKAAAGAQRMPLEPLAPIRRIVFDDHIDAGVPADLTLLRKDRLIRRRGWQFGDRSENVALIREA